MYAENRQTRRQHLLIGEDKGKACGGQCPIPRLNKSQMWHFIALAPLGMKSRSQIIKIEGQPMRLMGTRRGHQETRKGGQLPHQVDLAGILQLAELGLTQLRRGLQQMRENLAHVAKHGLGPGMRILHVKHRVVFGLLEHLGQVEIERRIVLAVKAS